MTDFPTNFSRAQIERDKRVNAFLRGMITGIAISLLFFILWVIG